MSLLNAAIQNALEADAYYVATLHGDQLHLELLYGDEPHHVVEALFKAWAKAVDFACQRDPRIADRLPSTKGRL